MTDENTTVTTPEATIPAMDRVRIARDPNRPGTLDYVGELRTKHKVVTVKDVNAANLQPTDVLATVDGKPLADGEPVA